MKVQVGRKLVRLTAYCPDDALGLAACDYVLRRVRDALGDGVSHEQMFAYLCEREPEYARLKEMIDAGWKLPKNPPNAVDPMNVNCELRIVAQMLREQREQHGAL